MCTNWEVHYKGCRARGYPAKECSVMKESSQCKQGLEGNCEVKNVTKEWRQGICPDHREKLPEKERKKQDEFVQKGKERWDKGEVRVWSYKKDKPSRWHSEPSSPSCVIM
jgi:hypothetical protein